jgi:hypothetical protein
MIDLLSDKTTQRSPSVVVVFRGIQHRSVILTANPRRHSEQIAHSKHPVANFAGVASLVLACRLLKAAALHRSFSLLGFTLFDRDPHAPLFCCAHGSDISGRSTSARPREPDAADIAVVGFAPRSHSASQGGEVMSLDKGGEVMSLNKEEKSCC